MSAQKMLSNKNIKKHPQFVVEGNTPATYGTTPTNPDFTAPGSDTTLEITNSPEFVDNRYGGKIDRQGITKTREVNTATSLYIDALLASII